jgi:alpha-1,6-mannosyltransferase
MSVEAPLGVTPRSGTFELTTPSAAVVQPARELRREHARTRREHAALAAVTAVPLLGLLVCVAGTHTNALVPQSIRPVTATSMAGPLSLLGFTLGVPEVVAAIVLMFAGYLFAVNHVELVSTRTVIWAVVALNVIVLLGPPLFSTDVFSYQMYGRMLAIYHANPYTHGANAILLDPLYNYIGAAWIYTPSVYGPLFTFISAAFASASIAGSELAFKLIAAAASAGTLYLIWQSARRRGLNPTRSIALFGLNPVVTVYGVGGGHNDLLMVLLTTWGVYALLTKHERASGALMVAATAIKLTAGVVMPFALLSGVGLDAGRRRRAFLGGAAAVALVVAGASFAVFGSGILHMSHTLQSVQDQGTWESFPGFIFAITGWSVTSAIRTVLVVGLAVSLLWLLRRVWQGKMDWIDGAAWATFALLVTAWSMLPWYVCWMLPLVALGTSRRLWRVTMVMTVIGAAMMIADAVPHSY